MNPFANKNKRFKDYISDGDGVIYTNDDIHDRDSMLYDWVDTVWYTSRNYGSRVEFMIDKSHNPAIILIDGI